MYEHHADRLLSTREFAMRVARNGGYVFVAVACALGIGMSGYHFIVGLSWIDSFLDAAMILGGMGPIKAPTTTPGKIFAGLYALFSGLFFIFATGILLAPFIHRLMHRFHLEQHHGGVDE